MGDVPSDAVMEMADIPGFLGAVFEVLPPMLIL